MSRRILVVDDEREVISLIEKYLLREGYAVRTAVNAEKALQLMRQEKYDLIILDVILPGANGLDICRQLRRDSMVPILLISAKADDADKVLGLGLGADDYITKPFSLNELVARVKAHIRRYDHQSEARETAGADGPIICGPLEISGRSRVVRLNGRPISLTGKEFDLLSFLCINAEQVFSREYLYERIWGHDAAGDSRTIMVHISRLREKIEADPARPHHLLTVWGAGYKFCRDGCRQ
jgi:DNA-binding response OmpR family regulator